MKKTWDFRVESWRYSDGTYKVKVTTASGKEYEREGWSHLQELLRLINDPEPNRVNHDRPATS